MKIYRRYLKKLSLQEFAELHNLTLEIGETFDGAYHVSFQRVEIKDGPRTVRTGTGFGASEYLALVAYLKNISGQVLIVGAGTKARAEISALNLTCTPEEFEELLKGQEEVK